VKKITHKQAYYICQLIGWLGLVAIEVINYTFFIVRKFDIKIFYAFSTYALVGFIITHLFRYFLLKTNFFHKKKEGIWLFAIAATFILSLLMTIIISIPFFLTKEDFVKNFTFIDIGGSTINWMRYIGVWIIIYFMYKILQENSTIQKEKLELENIAKTTELELLKTQLNPHFLFNALNAIKALVIINPDESRDAIVKLSELLRFTLQYGKERLIPFNDEIKEVKKYLDLEKLRFESKLNVIYTINDDTLSQTIPPATILTLVENSIKHGISKQMEDGTIFINSYIRDNLFYVEIINPGNYNNTNHSGIGLKHITKRFDEIYGTEYDFKIEQKNDLVIATIQTPLSWQ
jgi:sensor histidine kinase YesM